MKTKRFLSLLLCACMTLALLPLTVFAAQGSDFVVTTNMVLDTDYTYDASGVLTFINPGSYTVSMAALGSTTNTDRIVVTGGTADNPVNLTLDNVSIELNRANGGCAFDIFDGAVVSLMLTGENKIQSGSTNAGIQCPDGATLVIGGNGSLEAIGGQIVDGSNRSGAGIGGGAGMSGGTITINSGTVEAIGGYNSAGIGGGGNDGGGGTVIINGGSVSAYGGVYTLGGIGTGAGAGIGGGSGLGTGGSGTVIINGGNVNAYGGGNNVFGGGGSGIGGGSGYDGWTVSISGGTVNAFGGNGFNTFSGGGSGIGGGSNGDGGTVTISGGTVNAYGGSSNSRIP